MNIHEVWVGFITIFVAGGPRAWWDPSYEMAVHSKFLA